MTPSKRLFDVIVALVLGCILLPFIVVIGIIILVLDGRPIFYVSERMRSPTQSFALVKFLSLIHI